MVNPKTAGARFKETIRKENVQKIESKLKDLHCNHLFDDLQQVIVQLWNDLPQSVKKTKKHQVNLERVFLMLNRNSRKTGSDSS